MKWVHSTYAGVDALCAKGMPRNYILTKISTTSAPMMGEYVFTYAFYFYRHLEKYQENQFNHKWDVLPYGFICNKKIK